MQDELEYWLRFRGRIQGPMTADAVREGIRAGRISSMHEVSRDRKLWQPVRSCAELMGTNVPVSIPVPEEEYHVEGPQYTESTTFAAEDDDETAKLKALKKLLDEGLIDDKDYKHKKAALLGVPNEVTPHSPQRANIAQSGRSMYCNECGVQLLDRAIVCPTCGCPTRNHKAVSESREEVGGPTIAAFYIFSFIFAPLVGFIGLIYLLAKGRAGHALGVFSLSIFAAFFWYALLYEYM